MITTNNQALSQLIGLPLRATGRAANLLWLHFGEWRRVPDRQGGTRTVGDWALHIQCDWNIATFDGEIVSPADYYVSPDNQTLGDNWDIVGANRFDEIAARLRAEFEIDPPTVESVECNDMGGFALYLSDGKKLNVPIIGSGTGHEEAWRLFQPMTNREHFVVLFNQ